MKWDTDINNDGETTTDDIGWVCGASSGEGVETDPLFTAWGYNYNNLTNLPPNLDIDSTDDFTNADETDQVFTAWDKSIADITNQDGAYFSYQPNNTPCAEGQILIWDNENARWVCAARSGEGVETDPLFTAWGYNYNNLTNLPPNLDIDSTDDFTNADETDQVFTAWDKSIADITNQDGAYFSYQPNNTPCAEGQILIWDNENARWVCAARSGEGVETDPLFTAWGYNYNNLTNLPPNLDIDSTDDFTNADETDQVFTAWNKSVADITNQDGAYFSYQPNNTPCAEGQILIWDNENARWVCAARSGEGVETDPLFTAWGYNYNNLTNLPPNLDIDSTDDFDGAWGSLTGVPLNLDTDSTDDFDGDYASLANTPNFNALSTATLACAENQIAKWNGSAWACSDDVDTDTFAAWDKTSGISITESQISDLQAYLTAESDPAFTAWDKDFADLINTPTVAYTTNSVPWADLANIPANLDTDSTDDFDGAWGSLTGIPANLDTDSTDDFDGDYASLANVPNFNALSTATLACAENQIAKWNGSAWACSDDVDTDTFAAWDKTSGISITESQISDLQAYLTAESDPAFTAWDKDFADLINTPTVAYTTNSVPWADLANIPANLDTDSTDDFDGDYASLANTPNFNALSTATLACAENQIAKWNGTSWACSDDVDTDTFAAWDKTSGISITESQISDLQAYLTAETDPAFTAWDKDFADLINTPTVAYTTNSVPWADLANIPANLDTDSTDDFDGAWGSLTGVPLNIDTDSTDDFDGDYASLANTPNFNALSTATLACAENQIAKWNGSAWACSDDVDTDTFAAWDKTSGISITESQISDLQAYLTAESDPAFTAWDKDFADLINTPTVAYTTNSVPWADLANIPANLDTDSTDDFDGDYASLANTPNFNALSTATLACAENQIAKWNGSAWACSDDVDTDTFAAWDKSSGISITESQISDLQAYLTAESDPAFTAWDKDFADLINTPTVAYTTNSVPWADLANIPANLDTDSTDDFDGDYASLANTPNFNALSTATLACAENQIAKWNGTSWACSDDVDTDTFAAWDKTSGISITESQISDLQAYLTAETDPAFTAWDKDFADLINTPTVAYTTNSVPWADLANIPANLDTDSTDDFDGAWGSLTGVPLNIDTDSTDDFDGDYASLANTPNFNALSTATLACAENQIAKWNGSAWACSDDVDTDTFAAWDKTSGISITESQISDLQAYLTAESDPAFTAWDKDFADLINTPTVAYTTNSVPWADLANIPANLDTDSTDDFDGAWGSLTGIPANLDTDSTDDFDGDYASLANTPNFNALSTATLACAENQIAKWNGTSWACSDDVDTDTFAAWDKTSGISITESQISDLQAYLTAETDPAFTAWDKDFADLINTPTVAYTTNSVPWADLANIPANLDTDSTDDFDGAWGSLTGVPLNIDTDSTDDFDGDYASLANTPNFNALSTATLACAENQIAKWNGSAWACSDDVDTDTFAAWDKTSGISITESQISDLQAYLTAESDPAFTAWDKDFADLINTPTVAYTTNSVPWADLANIPANLDTDSTDDFDGAWGSLTGVPLNIDTDSTDDFDGDYASLANTPNFNALSTATLACAENQIAKWNGTSWACSDDVDTDTFAAWDKTSGISITESQISDLQAYLTAETDPAFTAWDKDFADLINTPTVAYTTNSVPWADLANIPANLDTDSTDDFDGAWGSLTGVPLNIDTDSTDDFDGDYASLANTPNFNALSTATLACAENQIAKWNGSAWACSDDVDTDTFAAWDKTSGISITESQISDLQAYLTAESDPAFTAWDKDFADLINTPTVAYTTNSVPWADLANIPANLDTDSTDDFDGDYASLANTPNFNALSTATLACAENQIAKWNGSAWACSDDVDTDTFAAWDKSSGISITESQISDLQAYLTAESDPAFTAWDKDFADLINTPTVAYTTNSVPWADLANIPANLDTDSTDDFDGDYASLANTPNFNALSTATLACAENQIAKWNGTSWACSDDVDTDTFAAWDKTSGISITESQISDLQAYLTAETDPAFTAWDKDFADLINTPTVAYTTNSVPWADLANIPANLDTDSTDDFDGAWGSLTGVPLNIDTDSTDDFDGDYASLANTPNFNALSTATLACAENQIAKWNGSAWACSDDVDTDTFAAWDKTSGISITESQISDLQAYLTAESDPAFTAWDKDFADLINTPTVAYTTNSVPWADLANIPANLDTDSTDDFDGAWGSLTGIPANLDTDSTDDFDGDYASLANTPNFNALSTATLACAENQIAKWNGTSWACSDDVDTDTFAAWDKTSGISITESQISDLQAYLTAETDPAFTAWDKDFADLINTPTVAYTTNSVPWADLANIPANLDTDSTDDFDGAWGSLTGVPLNIDTDSTDDFDGDYASLANTPNFNALSTATLACAENQIAKWNGSAWACSDDVDTDTFAAWDKTSGISITESQISDLQAYLTAESDPAFTAWDKDFADLINTPTVAYTTNSVPWADLANIPANLDTDSTDDFDGAWGSLTGVPLNIDTDSTDDFDGDYASLANTPNFNALSTATLACAENQIAKWNGSAWACSDDVDTDTFAAWDKTSGISITESQISDLQAYLTAESDPAFTAWDKDFADLINTPTVAYTTNSVPWADLANIPANLDTDSTDDFDGAWGSLTGVPLNIDTDSTDDFDGDYTSLANTPNFNALSTATLACAENQIAKWNGSAWACSDDVDTDTFAAWDKTSGISITESQISDLQAYLTAETDPAFAAWDKDFADLINTPTVAYTTNSVPWADLANIPANLDTDSTDDFDGDYASLANTPNFNALSTATLACAENQIAKWNGSAWACSDDVDTDTFAVWDKTSGISITESQISDLQAYLTAETDPAFAAWDKDFADLINTPTVAYTTNSVPWADLANIPANLDTDSTDDFDGDYASLANVPNFNALSTATLACAENQIAKWNGTAWACSDDVDTDTFAAWDKTSGISITESQISDLQAYLTAETDPAFTAWDKDFADLINTPTVAYTTNSVPWADLANIPANLDTDSTDDFDGDYASLANTPNFNALSTATLACAENQIAKWNGSAWACSDDVDTDTFAAWDKTSGISITESQISDLQAYLTAETDPAFTAWDKDFADLINTPTVAYTTNSVPWADLANIPANLDTDSTDDFDGDYASLANTPNFNALSTATLACAENQIAKWNGSAWACSDDVDTDTFAAWDKTSGISITESQISDLQAYLTAETDPAFTAWDKDFADLINTPTVAYTTNSVPWADLANIPANLDTDSTDDFDGAWGSLTGIPANLDTDSTDDFDGDYASLANTPNFNALSTATLACAENQIAKWNGTAWACSDDVDTDTFAAWDKTSGISITESQISDLQAYLTAESDPAFTAWDKDFADLINTPTVAYTTNSVPWADLANIPANLDTDSTDDFDGAWGSLTGIPANLDTDSTDDFDGDYASLANVPNFNALSTATLACAENQIAKWNGSAWACSDDVDTDTFAAWDKTSGISITESQISDLQAYLTAETDPAFTAWDKDFADLINTPTVAYTTNSVPWADLANIPANLDTDSTDDFDGDYASLANVPNFNALSTATLACAENQIAKWNGSAWACSDDVDTDTFAAWDKTSGISITESQISDLQAYLTAETDPAFTAWDKDFADLINTPTVAYTTNSVPWADLANIPANLDTDSTDDFDGDYASLANTPNFNALSTATLACAENQIAKWNGTSWACSDDVDTDTFAAWDKTSGISITESQISDLQAYLTAETDPAFAAWDKTSGISITESQISDLQAYLTAETDPAFAAWDKTSGISITESQISDLQAYLTAESDPAFTAWDKDFADLINTPTVAYTTNSVPWADLANIPANLDTDSTDDFDGDYASLANVPNFNALSTATLACAENQIAKWNGSAWACSDDVDTDTFAVWDKTSGISITESQISDLQAYLTAETDPAFAAWDKDFADLINTPTVAYTTNSVPWADLANIPANLDTDSTDDFDGAWGSLTGIPANLDTDSTDDFDGAWNSLTGVPLNIDTDSTDDFDGDYASLANTPNFNALSTATLACAENQIAKWNGSAWACSDDVDTDTFAAWDKTSGISITESQISDLQAYLTAESDPAFTAWDKDFADLINTPTVAYTTNSVPWADLANIPANLDTDSTDDFDGAWGSLTGIPANLDTDSTDDFDGDYASLANAPNFNALSTATLACAENQIAKWNGTAWACSDDVDTEYWSQSGNNISYVSDGSVLIGNQSTTPSAPLHIHGESSELANPVPILMKLDSSSTLSPSPGIGAIMEFSGETSDGTNKAIAHIGAQLTNTTTGTQTGDLSFSTANGAINSGYPVERMRIRSNGNVGIGTSGPLSPLHIVSDEKTEITLESSRTDEDTIGSILFKGFDNNSQKKNYARIEAAPVNTTAGSEDGYISLQAASNGYLEEMLLMGSLNDDILGVGASRTIWASLGSPDYPTLLTGDASESTDGAIFVITGRNGGDSLSSAGHEGGLFSLLGGSGSDADTSSNGAGGGGGDLYLSGGEGGAGDGSGADGIDGNTILGVDYSDTIIGKIGIQTTSPTANFHIGTSLAINRSAISDQNYTATETDNLIAYTALTATRTVTLPDNICTEGRLLTIKDESGNAGTYNITLDPEGSTTIDGAANFVIDANYNSVDLYCNGSHWFIK